MLAPVCVSSRTRTVTTKAPRDPPPTAAVTTSSLDLSTMPPSTAPTDKRPPPSSMLAAGTGSPALSDLATPRLSNRILAGMCSPWTWRFCSN
ncbi:hypothetical protein BDP67DRAFT_620838 [Colletotrichum lupini]|nr:hypothetical protein BDP67DRAFT_620838 [Colletotrichum lupini]